MKQNDNPQLSYVRYIRIWLRVESRNRHRRRRHAISPHEVKQLLQRTFFSSLQINELHWWPALSVPPYPRYWFIHLDTTELNKFYRRWSPILSLSNSLRKNGYRWTDEELTFSHRAYGTFSKIFGVIRVSLRSALHHRFHRYYRFLTPEQKNQSRNQYAQWIARYRS